MVIWDIIFCFIVYIYCYFFIIHKIVVKLVIRFCYFTLIDIYSIYYFLLFVVICSFIFNFTWVVGKVVARLVTKFYY